MTRFLKTLHGWLGVIILPWIVLAGFTGLYENHGFKMLSLLPETRFRVEMLQGLPAAPVNEAAALALADRLLPAPHLPLSTGHTMTRLIYEVISPNETLDVDQATGAYWLIGPYATSLYDAQGSRIATQVQWGALLRRLHRAGWASDTFGTWPADLAATALMVFGISGLWLFFAPRVRRWKNRWARRRA
jgi:hypothetical protein